MCFTDLIILLQERAIYHVRHWIILLQLTTTIQSFEVLHFVVLHRFLVFLRFVVFLHLLHAMHVHAGKNDQTITFSLIVTQLKIRFRNSDLFPISKNQ